MTFLQSSITFGSYRFPLGFYGVDLQSNAVIDELKIPYLDGTSAPQGSRNSKTIHLEGIIGGWGAVDSTGAYILSADAAEAEYQTMLAALEGGYQQLSLGQTPARYILAQKAKLTKTYQSGSGRRAIQVEIELLAQDPRWLSSTVHALAPALVVNGNASVAASNVGNTSAYPKFTLNCSGAGASIVNPSFQTQDAGNANIVTVTLTYTMVPGDVIVVDGDPRNRASAVLLNGSPRLDLLGTTGILNGAGTAAMFPYLNAGSGAVVVGTGAGSVLGTSNASVSYQDAWL